MARPLRIEFPGAVYHVTSRGDRREPIFIDDEDRQALLGIVAQALSRFDVQALSYCLMNNHYHFVLHTRQANLSLLMRHINGVYTQSFNRRHDKVGHLFQGRFKAILVDRDAYLLEVAATWTESGARPGGEEARGLGLVELPRACGSNASTGLDGHRGFARLPAGSTGSHRRRSPPRG